MPEQALDQVFQNGVLVSSTARTISDAEILRRDAPARLRARYAALRQWALDADAVANQATNVTPAQQKALFDRFGRLCDGLADLLLAQSLDS